MASGKREQSFMWSTEQKRVCLTDRIGFDFGQDNQFDC